MSRHPTVKWAQRPDVLFITIELPDAKDAKLKLEPEGKFHFSALSGADNTPYEVDMDLFDKVNVRASKSSVGLRNNICYLIKKAESKWWNRLLKQGGKPPVFLKVDWDKWVDEDEEDDSKLGADMEDLGDIDFSKLSMGGGDFSGGGADNDDAEDDEEIDDSDNEEENVGEILEEKKKEAAPMSGETETKA